jgi:hypothetical protein
MAGWRQSGPRCFYLGLSSRARWVEPHVPLRCWRKKGDSVGKGVRVCVRVGAFGGGMLAFFNAPIMAIGGGGLPLSALDVHTRASPRRLIGDPLTTSTRHFHSPLPLATSTRDFHSRLTSEGGGEGGVVQRLESR